MQYITWTDDKFSEFKESLYEMTVVQLGIKYSVLFGELPEPFSPLTTDAAKMRQRIVSRIERERFRSN